MDSRHDEVASASPYLALAVGYVLFYVVAVEVRMLFGTRSVLDALVAAFMEKLVYSLVAVVQIRRRRNSNRRLPKPCRFRVFIRILTPRRARSGIWNQGIATPGRGSLRFQLRLLNLKPSGRPTDLKM